MVKSHAVQPGVGNASAALAATPDGQQLLFGLWDPSSLPEQGAARQGAALVRLHLSSGRADTIRRYEGRLFIRRSAADNVQTHANILFASVPVVAARDSVIVFAPGGSPTYEMLGWDGAEVGRTEWPAAARAVTPADVAVVADFRDAYREQNPGAAWYVPRVASQGQVEAFMLYTDKALLASDGSVWLRRYRITDPGLSKDLDETPEQWLRFTHDGVPRARVTLAPRTQLRAVSRAFAIAVVLDSMDVPHIERFAIPAEAP